LIQMDEDGYILSNGRWGKNWFVNLLSVITVSRRMEL
jgi:hypothetical protein